MGGARADKKGRYQPVGQSRVRLSALLMLAIAGLSPASAQERVALVIGNAAYATAPLANPAYDARRISTALQRVGFDVETALDLSDAGMRRALSAFAARLTGDDTVALFYYVGHGVQLSGRTISYPSTVR